MSKMKEENVFNILLLKEIESYPCLYNYHLTEYTSKEANDKAWGIISEKLKKTPDECKARWKNLRGSLTRNLSQKLKCNGYAGRSPKTFYLTKYMQFIMPFAKSRHGYTYEELQKMKGEVPDDSIIKEDSQSSWNFSSEDMDNTFEETSPVSEPPIILSNSIERFNETASTSTHIKDPLDTTTRSIEQIDHYDADKHFLLSLLPHINCFTPSEKLQFQIKTLNVIDDIMNKRETGNKD